MIHDAHTAIRQVSPSVGDVMRYRNKCLIEGATHFQPSPIVGALHGALGIFFGFVGHYFPADLLWHSIRLLSYTSGLIRLTTALLPSSNTSATRTEIEAIGSTANPN
jgi:hypothetical protein